MPRIVHVISTPSGVGGTERVVASLARASFDRGWESMVVNPFALDPERSALRAICGPVPYAGMRCQSNYGLPLLRRWLRRAIRDFQPHIVHAHLFHAEVATASLRLPNGSKSVLTHHHGDHLVRQHQRRRVRLDDWSCRRYDAIVAISDWVRNFLIERGHPARKVEMIKNGWEGEPSAHSGDSSGPTLVCVANFRPEKGHADLLAAFALARREVPGTRLRLVGEGDMRAEIERLAARMGLSGAVEFAGTAKSVWPELAAAEIFVLASLTEAMGIAVLEAMAAGLPVVATGVGGLPELVEDGREGFLVDPGDAEGMSRAIVRLVGDAGLRARMGRAAESKVADRTMSRAQDSYFNLYEALADSTE
jgi:glycosyltransferase involved in cell wall biosynthesis